MGGHRKIAEQPLADRDGGVLRGDYLAKPPHRNVAEFFRRRKQLPVFQIIAGHRVGNIVGGKREAVDLDQQRVIWQGAGIRQLRLNEFAALQIVAGDNEVGRFHVFDPGGFAAGIFAVADDRFATASLFKTAFALGSTPMTPSRRFVAR